MAEHNEIGRDGENIATTFLVKLGFSIVSRNFRSKYGEIDIVAKKDNTIHFVEVKSVKVRDLNSIENLAIKPEDNLTYSKWTKILKTIDYYLFSKNRGVEEGDYQVDLACVYVDTEKREGRVKLMQNVHLD